MDEISWTDRLKYEEVLHSVKEEMDILHTIKSTKANWICHFLRRNCLLKCFTKERFNLLKATGHVMHQQFNIQQLYVLPTLYLCVLYLSENKQRLVPLTA